MTTRVRPLAASLAKSLPPNVTPCYSPNPTERAWLAWLFESTDLIDHREAAALCSGCPFRLGCFGLAAEQAKGAKRGVPDGTWGGVLFASGKIKTPQNLARGAV